MSRFGSVFMLGLLTFASSLAFSATGDGIFPQIIPKHGGNTVVIEKQIGVISNTVEKTVEQVVVLSNTVERVETQTIVLSNTVEKVVEQVVVVSNQIDKVDTKVGVVSNEVDVVKATTLKSDRVALTNNPEFVSSVRTIADAGTYPIEEFNQMKVDIAKYRAAFSNLSEIVVSEETNMDEIKAAIRTIKDASAAIINEQ